MKTIRALMIFTIATVLLGTSTSARAEVTEITVAQQYGVSFLPLMIMEARGLVEKRAAQSGVPNVTVVWAKVAGPSVMNDGLISNSIHFAAQGAPSMITLWDKTRGQIKGVAAMTTYPLYLVTRNQAVKTVADFTEADKIAVPSIKISTQAIMLQMAAASLFGDSNFSKFDSLTITLSHPDALLAFTNNSAGVNAHFTSSPFYEQEMKVPGARLVTTNYDILGGPATAVLLTTSAKFRTENPKLYKVFFESFEEAINIINKDKRAASQVYLDVSKDNKNTVEDILAIISDKDYNFTMQPQKVLKTAQFMAKIGSIKQSPSSVDELFFPEVGTLKGD